MMSTTETIFKDQLQLRKVQIKEPGQIRALQWRYETKCANKILQSWPILANCPQMTKKWSKKSTGNSFVRKIAGCKSNVKVEVATINFSRPSPFVRMKSFFSTVSSCQETVAFSLTVTLPSLFHIHRPGSLMNLHFRAQSAEGYEINRTSTNYAEQKKNRKYFRGSN